MQDALTKEVRQKVQEEILEVLRKNNLPTNEVVTDCVWALTKVVSCQHQNNGSK
jgi:hypothetical protein